MTNEEYLEKWHHTTQSMIGLICIQKDFEGVTKVLATWKPKLKELEKNRIREILSDSSEEEIKQIMPWWDK